MIVLAGLPTEGMDFPGSEFLGRIDEAGYDVDWALRMTTRSGDQAAAQNRRALIKLNDQYGQREGEMSHAMNTLDRVAKSQRPAGGSPSRLPAPQRSGLPGQAAALQAGRMLSQRAQGSGSGGSGGAGAEPGQSGWVPAGTKGETRSVPRAGASGGGAAGAAGAAVGAADAGSRRRGGKAGAAAGMAAAGAATGAGAGEQRKTSGCNSPSLKARRRSAEPC